MITLCYTQILLRRLRIAKPDLASMPPTNALRNWYANLICIGWPQMVMATSERSLARDWYWRHGLAPMDFMLRFAETPNSALL